MDLVAALGSAIDQAPLGPAGSFAKQVLDTPTPAAIAEQRSTSKQLDLSSAILVGLVGLSIGTAVSAGVGYGLGSWLYPEVGGVPFAKVGAASYLAPIALYVGASTLWSAAK